MPHLFYALLALAALTARVSRVAAGFTYVLFNDSRINYYPPEAWTDINIATCDLHFRGDDMFTAQGLSVSQGKYTNMTGAAVSFTFEGTNVLPVIGRTAHAASFYAELQDAAHGLLLYPQWFIDNSFSEFGDDSCGSTANGTFVHPFDKYTVTLTVVNGSSVINPTGFQPLLLPLGFDPSGTAGLFNGFLINGTNSGNSLHAAGSVSSFNTLIMSVA